MRNWFAHPPDRVQPGNYSWPPSTGFPFANSFTSTFPRVAFEYGQIECARDPKDIGNRRTQRSQRNQMTNDQIPMTKIAS